MCSKIIQGIKKYKYVMKSPVVDVSGRAFCRLFTSHSYSILDSPVTSALSRLRWWGVHQYGFRWVGYLSQGCSRV